MPGAALLEITGAAVETLQAALEALNQPDVASQQRDAPAKRYLLQAAERVKNDAAKVGVMCGESGAASLPPDVAQSMAGALQQSCLAFCACCYALSSAAAGATLRKDVRKLAGSILEPSIALIRAIEGSGDLKRHIGLVWQGCDATAKAALDNKGAIFKGLAGVMAVLKDTLREMEELEQEGASSGGYESDDDDDDEQQQWQQQQQQQQQTSASSAEAVAAATAGTMSALEQQQQWQQQQREQPSAAENAGAAGPAPAGAASSCNGQAGSDEYEGGTRNLRELADLDFETGKLSGHERELLSSCRQLMETAVAVLKALGRALLQGPPLAGSEGATASRSGSEALDGWESCLYHARHLQRCVEDLGAAMYPPQDLEEVSEAAEALATTAELMLDECPDPDAVGEVLGQLTQQVQAAQELVAAAVARARS